MIKIKSLKLANFGSFVGEHTLDFSSRPNLIQIDSINNNTSGSSGGGKSTLFNSIEYVLGICDVPSTVLQSRLTKNAMWAELELETPLGSFTIKRGKSEGLTITGATESSGSVKVSEERLDQILGIHRDLIRPMLHKRQGEKGFFLSKTSKEAYQFMMKALSMDSLQTKQVYIESLIKTISGSLDTVSTILPSKESSLSSILSIESTLVAPIQEVPTEILAILEANLRKSEEYLVLTNSKMRSALALVEKPKDQFPNAFELTAQVKVLNDQMNALVLERDSLNTLKLNKQKEKGAEAQSLRDRIQLVTLANYQIPGLESQLDKVKKEIVIAYSKQCPTCAQGLQNNHSHVLDGLVIKAKTLDAALTDAKSKTMGLEELKAELKIVLSLEVTEFDQDLSDNNSQKAKIELLKNSIQSQINNHSMEVRANNAEAQNNYNIRLKEVELSHKDDLEDANNKHLAAARVFSDAKNKDSSFKEAKTRFDIQFNKIATEKTKLEAEIAPLQADLIRLNKELRVATEALRLVKSYSNQLFQDALAQVAERATEILSRIPNMSNASIVFDSQKETKSGSVKEEINPIVSIGEEIGIPLKSVSGGERASIDLAVDLAIVEMIESNTGNGIDLFILDEPFDGLDAICRENCLDVLRMNGSDRKIILVDHSTETKQLVKDRIVVIKDGSNSRLES